MPISAVVLASMTEVKLFVNDFAKRCQACHHMTAFSSV